MASSSSESGWPKAFKRLQIAIAILLPLMAIGVLVAFWLSAPTKADLERFAELDRRIQEKGRDAWGKERRERSSR